VSFIEGLQRKLLWSDALIYTIAQVLGCCADALLAHAMFELPIWQHSAHIRTGPAQCLAEGVATFGLLLVVLGHRRSEDAPWMVACWIGAAPGACGSAGHRNRCWTFCHFLCAGRLPKKTAIS
jgi:glycerol uptake facilitator-like aquaporin